MELAQGKEIAGKSDVSGDRKRYQTRSEKLYDRECRRRAAYWSEREGTHNTEAGKVGLVHEGAAAPNHLLDGNMASDKTRVGS